jgi:hypothetical protein
MTLHTIEVNEKPILDIFFDTSLFRIRTQMPSKALATLSKASPLPRIQSVHAEHSKSFRFPRK